MHIFEYQTTVYFSYPKKIRKFLLCSVIFCLLLFKIRKYDKIMAITVFDIFMARSLRSLAGFCMGEYGDFEVEIIYL